MKTLTPKQRDILEDFISHTEDDEVSIYKDYSGRGMCGRNCFGFSVGQYTNSHKMIVELVCFLYEGRPELDDDSNEMDEAEHDEYTNLIELLNGNISTDSLGMGTIIYFPNISWQ